LINISAKKNAEHDKAMQELRKLYNDMYDSLMNKLKNNLEENKEKCTLRVGEVTLDIPNEETWSKTLNNVEHKAIDNFIYTVQTSGYPCSNKFEFQEIVGIYFGGRQCQIRYHVFKEISIRLK